MKPAASCDMLSVCLVDTWNVTANFPAQGGTVTFAEDGTASTTTEIFEAFFNGVYLDEFDWQTANTEKELTLTYSDEMGSFSITYDVTIVNTNKLNLTLSLFTEDLVVTLTR